MEDFLRYRFGGFIFGGAYTWSGLFSEFYGILLHSLIKQLVRRFCFHRGFFQGLLGLRFRDTNCHRPPITEIPSNNPIQFTGMI